MSNMKYDAVTQSGIRIIERVDIPEVRRPSQPCSPSFARVSASMC